MPEITVNDSDIIRSREELFSFFGGLDAKRPQAWEQYGYKQTLTFQDFRNAYERGGAGHGAVHRLIDRCWQEFPRIKEPKADKPTPFEEGINELLDEIDGWQKLMEFDRRNMIGRYAGLIYRLADGRALREPLVTARKLVDLVPLFEDQLEVETWDNDVNSPTYGEPTMYRFRQRSPSSPGDTRGQPDEWAPVHPSRVQILAEGSVGGPSNLFEGVPLLKAGFNNLVDIEKLSGGGAESALKNSARTLVLKFEGNSSPQTITMNADGTPSGKTLNEAMEDKTRLLNRTIDASIVTQGGEVTTLQTVVSDLGPQFEIAANLFAASVRMPFTVLFGQQTGRLASDEDQKDMVSRCSGRQQNVLTPALKQFVKRMQACGVFAAGKFEIEWPDLGAPTDEQRLDSAGKMAQASKTAFDGGLTEPLFDANEIRKMAGFEKRADDGMPTEADKEAALRAEREHELALKAATPAMQQPGAKPRAVA